MVQIVPAFEHLAAAALPGNQLAQHLQEPLSQDVGLEHAAVEKHVVGWTHRLAAAAGRANGERRPDAA